MATRTGGQIRPGMRPSRAGSRSSSQRAQRQVRDLHQIRFLHVHQGMRVRQEQPASRGDEQRKHASPGLGGEAARAHQPLE